MARVTTENSREAEAVEVEQLARRLPPEFVLGAATSAYQIEGAVGEDGRGESIWDAFSSTPGNTFQGQTGAVSCDHYHRYREDVGLMRELGLQGYRFSISWPRIFPHGWGSVNGKGLDFYDRLVDTLLEAGIEPFATLFHWDLPLRLQDRGGWYSRDTAVAFGEYAAAVAGRLGDRVKMWITHNEPWCMSWLGHAYGIHAPGKRDGTKGAVLSAHHLLLSHGLAVQRIRETASGPQAGITLDLYPMYPATGSPEDEAAAWKADGSRNRWFLDPVLLGSYPADMTHLLAHLPEGASADLDTISAPIDFLGVNYYERQVVAAEETTGDPVVVHAQETSHADNGREIYPSGLTLVLTRLADDYKPPPIYITENGIAAADTRGTDGGVADAQRVAFLSQHLQATADAIEQGAAVKAYFAWSLIDNFEWSKGYDERERYGLIYIDWETLERIPKSSSAWYAGLISRHREH